MSTINKAGRHIYRKLVFETKNGDLFFAAFFSVKCGKSDLQIKCVEKNMWMVGDFDLFFHKDPDKKRCLHDTHMVYTEI